jgi:hypothetical protein
MYVAEFTSKRRGSERTERSAAHEHFLDLCEVVSHPKPGEAAPAGEWFTFERGATKENGGRGWADVWKRGAFGWEHKGPRKDLDAALRQLQHYRQSLENPPVLVVSDTRPIHVHTSFTNNEILVEPGLVSA